MCIGCILGSCTFAMIWGSGKLVSWNAERSRKIAMARVLAEGTPVREVVLRDATAPAT